MQRIDWLIDEMLQADELALVSALPDPRFRGTYHEYFRQIHRGVPVLGGGATRQRVNGMTVSSFGAFFRNVVLDTDPTLGPEAALVRMEEMANAARATKAAPTLVISPSPIGAFALAWSAPMQDHRTYLVDAHTGELVQRINRWHSESAIGFGRGITGATQKISVQRTGGGFEARDRLRPAEIVTLDAEGTLSAAGSLLIPDGRPWEPAVATDDDNQWSATAVVDGHAHLGLTYDYLFENHAWRAFDNRDGRIFSVVNVGAFPNAFFISAPFGPEGTGALVFGQERNGTPIVSLDVVAHEFMHGVTYAAFTSRTGDPLIGAHVPRLGPSSFTVGGHTYRCGDVHTFEDGQKAPLLCLDEDGNPDLSRRGRFALFLAHGDAINEAYSDIIGTAVEFAFHSAGVGPLHADYLLGEDSAPPFRRIDAPRAMAIGPTTFPDAMGQEFRFIVGWVGGRQVRYTGLGRKGERYFRISGDDYNGAHWNSTILSHAFYLAVEGGKHATSGRAIQGAGGSNRVQVEQAFFRALAYLAPSSASFRTMAGAIRQAAIDLHGAGSPTHAAIDQALTAVGL